MQQLTKIGYSALILFLLSLTTTNGFLGATRSNRNLIERNTQTQRDYFSKNFFGNTLQRSSEKPEENKQILEDSRRIVENREVRLAPDSRLLSAIRKSSDERRISREIREGPITSLGRRNTGFNSRTRLLDDRRLPESHNRESTRRIVSFRRDNQDNLRRNVRDIDNSRQFKTQDRIFSPTTQDNNRLISRKTSSEREDVRDRSTTTNDHSRRLMYEQDREISLRRVETSRTLSKEREDRGVRAESRQIRDPNHNDHRVVLGSRRQLFLNRDTENRQSEKRLSRERDGRESRSDNRRTSDTESLSRRERQDAPERRLSRERDDRESRNDNRRTSDTENLSRRERQDASVRRLSRERDDRESRNDNRRTSDTENLSRRERQDASVRRLSRERDDRESRNDNRRTSDTENLSRRERQDAPERRLSRERDDRDSRNDNRRTSDTENLSRRERRDASVRRLSRERESTNDNRRTSDTENLSLRERRDASDRLMSRQSETRDAQQQDRSNNIDRCVSLDSRRQNDLTRQQTEHSRRVYAERRLSQESETRDSNRREREDRNDNRRSRGTQDQSRNIDDEHRLALGSRLVNQEATRRLMLSRGTEERERTNISHKQHDRFRNLDRRAAFDARRQIGLTRRVKREESRRISRESRQESLAADATRSIKKMSSNDGNNNFATADSSRYSARVVTDSQNTERRMATSFRARNIEYVPEIQSTMLLNAAKIVLISFLVFQVASNSSKTKRSWFNNLTNFVAVTKEKVL